MQHRVCFAGLGIALVTAGCTLGPGPRDLAAAPRSPNPLHAGPQLVPVARGSDGHSMFRLVTAADREVCINGEVRMAAEDIEGATFVLKSFRSANDRDETVAGVDSRPAKVLTSGEIMAANNPQDRRALTDFQVCFPNARILTEETAYLVVRGKSVAPGLFAVWHFDDDVRY